MQAASSQSTSGSMKITAFISREFGWINVICSSQVITSIHALGSSTSKMQF
ncbi:Uncharacterised protein [Vibrio cholerae]|nr:Uncharacterised protein [Vibrio cholerae]